MLVFVGADWDSKKCVVLVDDGVRESRTTILRTPAAVLKFMSQWDGHEVRVGIEVGDELWARLFEEAGARVFVFDAKQSKRFHETLGSSGASDDARSATALCTMVQSARHREKALHRPSAQQRALDSLVRRHEMLSKDNGRLRNRLVSLLKQYHPALAACAKDVTLKSVLNLIEGAATPLEWNELKPDQQAELLRPFKAERREVLEAALGDCWVSMSSWESEAAGDQIRSVVRVLRVGLDEQNAAQRALNAAKERSQSMKAATSVTGIGAKLGAGIALAYEMEGDSDRDALNRRVCTAPVTNRSGVRGDTKPHVSRRFKATALMKNIGYLAAVQVVLRMKWAKAQFAHHRSRGTNAAGAYRRVGRSLMRIIHALIRDNVEFDEERYVAGLKAKGVEWAMAL